MGRPRRRGYSRPAPIAPFISSRTSSSSPLHRSFEAGVTRAEPDCHADRRRRRRHLRGSRLLHDHRRIIIPAWFLEPLRDSLREAGHQVAYAVLRAPLPVCASGHRAADPSRSAIVTSSSAFGTTSRISARSSRMRSTSAQAVQRRQPTYSPDASETDCSRPEAAATTLRCPRRTPW